MDQSEGKPANSFTSLLTRKSHNDGVRLMMDDGVNWLLIRGIESDAVHAAMTEVYRERAKSDPAAEGEKKEETEFRAVDEPLVMAAMVKGWSYDEPFTPESVDELIAGAPLSLLGSIVGQSCKRASFFTNAPKPSSPGQKSSSDSAPAETEQSKA